MTCLIVTKRIEQISDEINRLSQNNVITGFENNPVKTWTLEENNNSIGAWQKDSGINHESLPIQEIAKKVLEFKLKEKERDKKLQKLLPEHDTYYSETNNIKSFLKNTKYNFLIPVIDSLKIKFAYNSGLDDFGMAGSTSSSGNIEINKKYQTENVIAHEIIHGAIKKLEGLKGKINSDEFGNIKTSYKEFREEADKLGISVLNSLKEYKKLQKENSNWAKSLDRWIKHIEYSGLEEVITFALTDNNFQTLLKQLPSTYNKKTSNESLWNNFLSLIEKFLNIFKLEKTQLNAIIDLLNDYIPLGNIQNQSKNIEQKEITQIEQKEQQPKIEQQRKVDLVFDPITRRNRITLINRLFSNGVDLKLKEEQENLQRRYEETNDPQLAFKLKNLDRIDIIREKTPAGIYKEIYDSFNQFINERDNEIQKELIKINSKSNTKEWSEETKLEKASSKIDYKINEFKKIVDNYNELIEEASNLLSITEGIRIDEDITKNGEDIDQSDPMDNNEDDGTSLSFEEKVKEGWMTKFRELSSHESLSKEVRKAISTLSKKTQNKSGKWVNEVDDLGYVQYLDPSYVHATLIDKLKDMIDEGDMMPSLEKLTINKKWVQGIIDLLKKDETLYSKFYSNFRKDHVNYWVQTSKKMPNGQFKVRTVQVNKPIGISYLINEWRDNYESGNILDEDSIYDKNGNLNKVNAEKALGWINSINNKLNNQSEEYQKELVQQDSIFKTTNKLLNMLGISINPGILLTALTDYEINPNFVMSPPISDLLNNLTVIYKGIIQDKVGEKGDIINTFKSAFSNIANQLNTVTNDAVESSFREGDKSYYAHVNPNYLGKLMKNLKNVYKDEDRYKKYIEEEFKQYDWFYDKKTGQWKNEWLKLLESKQSYRDSLQHKVVLNHDKVDYTNWDSLTYLKVMLNEYEDVDNAKESFANYYIPIMSDAPSAEFIRFKKYKTGDELDDDGNQMHFEDILLNKMFDTVMQEYDRIMLVRQRKIARLNGDKSVEEITNFDKNGDKFHFYPFLNDVSIQGVKFVDYLHTINDADDIKTFVKEHLREHMYNTFEEEYKKWHKLGILDETEKGDLLHLKGLSIIKENARIADTLRNIKTLIGDKWNDNFENLLTNFSTNQPVDDRHILSAFHQVLEYIQNNKDQIDLKLADKVLKNLDLRNNAKEFLKEYYWNSKFATSQILQLTTTDLAFYKGVEDFQKRFKEIHAPSIRINTNATFNGEKVGKKWERTIYLKDKEDFISNVYDDIKEVLDQTNMSSTDKQKILKKYKEINVADAQAYRSLDSYREVMIMAGEWDDNQESAYNNFKNNKWDITDFNTIWQTKKPYVYTQVNKNSGIENKAIKVPVQHKNSEFLLLAIHNLVAGNLSKSPKLRAINKFMIDNKIDVVQFESTVKVGKQGTININNREIDLDKTKTVNGKTINYKEFNIKGRNYDITSYKDLKETLDDLFDNNIINKNEYDKILEPYQITDYQDVLDTLTNDIMLDGVENPNKVHTVSYEDYGFQTATPEHLIDKDQLVGTQIRKLITADIDENAILNVDGHKYNKKDFLKLYNEVNTENILQSYQEALEIFDNPKSVEEALLSEIKGNPRYGVDMIKACTLNEEGKFNIPLFDPIQSQRVQQLLNSIIKNRITKQKIKGGAAIQVTSYGLTNELNIVFEGSGEDKRIKYVECYLPAYSKEFYAPFIDEETHILNVDKLSDELRKAIGYRV